MEVPQPISELELKIGHRFGRRELLEHALTHSSQAREIASRGERTADNEQLEFLGDAILGFISAEELCRRFPDYREGELSKLRAHLVSEKHLVGVAREIELGKHLRLGKGEEKSGGRAKPTLLVDALEAVIAVVYLDGGLEPARDFIVRKIMNGELERIAGSGVALPLTDYKSELQEKLQASGRNQPAYILIKEDGPDHRKMFTVEARLTDANDKSRIVYAERAVGSTKKSAEQESARMVLKGLAAIASASASEGANFEKDSAIKQIETGTP